MVTSSFGLDKTGVEWSGVEWSGLEWSGVEWTAASFQSERELNSDVVSSHMGSPIEALRSFSET
eukprot:9472465-Pyramimonas_sp.AAC.1